ncbi:MAG: PAS domain S-box protein [Deltaproteobacteria bacterium]|nr:PAS domain S-box protein [Deltaproteobacteria bacterium]
MERMKNNIIFKKISETSLKNKIFFSTLAVILLISVLIALFTRWTLISSLTLELQRRGLGIAQSIAESSRGYMLTQDTPKLTSLLFDARLGERKFLIPYVFILDKKNNVIANTFTSTFPDGFHLANSLLPEQSNSIKLLKMGRLSVYDVAVPVKEGIYQIGVVHVGLNKNHIDTLIGKLRTTFVGFVSVVTIIFFVISHWLSNYITRPISELTKVSDEISRGNYNIKPDLKNKIKGAGSEVMLLADSFINMTNKITVSQIKLKESEGKYRRLVNSGPNPIFVIDRKTFEILNANPRAEETYGYTKDEFTGMLFTNLGPFEYKDSTLSQEENDDWQKPQVVSSKVQYYKKDNSPLYVSLHASPTQYKDRAALIIATTDITEMVEKDNQLIQASKMTNLGEMSAGIAHELNQPLNAIKMASEFLEMMIEKNRKIPQQDLYDVIKEVSCQVDRSAAIINRLRDFGRKADFTKEKIYINEPVKGVLEILGRQLRLQNIEVELDLNETIPPVLAHNNRLEQVIFNLITNARDALNQKQELEEDSASRFIRIRSSHDGERVTLTVSDNGIGIPESLRERIFEAFFTTKEMGEGMGLGLSISYGIVKDYGGDIDIESKEGLGTTFKLSFPCAL